MTTKEKTFESIIKAVKHLGGRYQFNKLQPIIAVGGKPIKVGSVTYAIGSIVVRGTHNGNEVRYVVTQDNTSVTDLVKIYLLLGDALLNSGCPSRVRCYKSAGGDEEELFSRDTKNKFDEYEVFTQVVNSVKSSYAALLMSGLIETDFTSRRFVLNDVFGERCIVVEVAAII